MSLTVFLAVLGAAFLHAAWSAMVRLGGDRLAAVVALSAGQAALGALALPFVAPPPATVWGWVAASAALHVGYQIMLAKAYETEELSRVYPLARGAAPAMTALVSVGLLGERLSPGGLAAVAAISCGVLLMAAEGGRGRRPGARGLALALGTAGFTTAYTLVDGWGARLSGAPIGYIVWAMIGSAAGTAACAALLRGPRVLTAARASLRVGAAAGAMSFASYAVAVWAFTQAPIALVAGLRETSILFAVVIAAVALKERVGPLRWAAAGLILLGAALARL